ncbi:protein FMC1 homolog [Limulus polyphemus]|uniref:Protein FMC1 homolog n=1 Tax=Limulus polyphemus TaxID=6850 RepID=A0ABM1BG29_LIMPO|nr:protein FMC1 homolog [Limulus polyphemus]
MSSNILHVIRGIGHEIRHSSSTKSVIQNPTFRYILEQTRKHQVTEKRVCRGQAELQYLAHTYLCYLSSIRRQKELHEMYHGKGERTIKETASLVGLTLPDDRAREDPLK